MPVSPFVDLLLLLGIRRLFGYSDDPAPFGVALTLSIFGTVFGFISLVVTIDHALPEPARLPFLFGAPLVLGAVLIVWRHLRQHADEELEARSEIVEIDASELDNLVAPEAPPSTYGWRSFSLDAEQLFGSVGFLLPLLAVRYFLGGMPIG